MRCLKRSAITSGEVAPHCKRPIRRTWPRLITTALEKNQGSGLSRTREFRRMQLEISFTDIQPLIPGYVLNEYGQLTGNYVHYSDIYCVAENGRIQIWLNKESYEAQD